MTAKTKHGHKAHRAAHGADAGTPHERLNRMHAMPNRAEGQPMSAAGSAEAEPAMPPATPPMGGGEESQGEGPSVDSEEGEQS